MRTLVGVALAMIGSTASSAPRPRPATTLTLRVESMTARPATFTVWTHARRRASPVDSVLPAKDSVTATTPASIPIDSATFEIHIRASGNAALRVRLLDEARELQPPANAWGRDLRLRRADDHFQVMFDFRPIQPKR